MLLRDDLGPRVLVLRLGHRVGRDKRVSTHVGLVARAFGASGLVLAGDRDASVVASIERVVRRWGGDGFQVLYAESWRSFLDGWKRDGGCVVHLTMYGIPVDSVIGVIRERCKEIVAVVGSEKVPPEVYGMADYNVSIGSQPHSEIAALAIFLDRLFEGRELLLGFTDSRLSVLPSPRGKRIIEVEPSPQDPGSDDQ